MKNVVANKVFIRFKNELSARTEHTSNVPKIGWTPTMYGNMADDSVTVGMSNMCVTTW